MTPAGLIPPHRGSYVLLINLDRVRRIEIGKRGAMDFTTGWYAYVGSAMGGLEARLRRHRRPAGQKRFHWHIDYLLRVGRLRRIFIKPSRRREECRISAALGKDFLVFDGFGASDCHCPGHLFHSSHEKPMITILRKIMKAEFPVE